KGKKFTTLDDPNAKAGTTSASNIQYNGTAVVGFYTNTAGISVGFLYKGGKYKSLDVPGASATIATDVSNKDVIVFYWENSSAAFEASMLTGKKYKTINVPGATSSYALDLDNEGDVTYEWQDSAGVIHAALLHGGKYFKYSYPKAYETYGGGLNDKSMIAGGYVPTMGANFQGFNATYK